jgi:hypothetical protein
VAQQEPADEWDMEMVALAVVILLKEGTPSFNASMQ